MLSCGMTRFDICHV